MGYDSNDPYIDEDGEPLMDMDDPIHSDEEQHQPLFEDDIDEVEHWRRIDRSPTPVYNESETLDPKSKPRKRLIKKASAVSEADFAPDFDAEEDAVPASAAPSGANNFDKAVQAVESSSRKRKKGKEEWSGSERRKDKRVKERRHGSGNREKLVGMKKGAGSSRRSNNHGDDPEEMKEMWDTIAGGDSEVSIALDLGEK